MANPELTRQINNQVGQEERAEVGSTSNEVLEPIEIDSSYDNAVWRNYKSLLRLIYHARHTGQINEAKAKELADQLDDNSAEQAERKVSEEVIDWEGYGERKNFRLGTDYVLGLSAISADGKLYTSKPNTNEIYSLDLESGELSQFLAEVHAASNISIDGDTLVALDDHELQKDVYKLRTFFDLSKSTTAHGQRFFRSPASVSLIHRLEASQKTTVCANEHGTLSIFKDGVNDIESILHIGTIPAFICSQGNKLVIGGSDGVIKVFDLAAENIEASQITISAGQFMVNSADVTQDGKIVAGCNDGTVGIYDINTGQEVLKIPLRSPELAAGDAAMVDDISIAPDGSIVASYNILHEDERNESYIVIIDPDSGEVIHKIPNSFPVPINYLKVMPDGKIVTGDWVGDVKVWGPKEENG